MKDSDLAILHHHIHRIDQVRRLDLKVPILPARSSDSARSDECSWQGSARPPNQQTILSSGRRREEADLECRSEYELEGDSPYRFVCLPGRGRETVKKRWVEQGIWNNKWNQFAYGRWKHEEPLELESESRRTRKQDPHLPFFPFPPKPQPKPRRAKSDDEKRRIAERRVIREREREASRPYHQFVYQISKERERIQEESTEWGRR